MSTRRSSCSVVLALAASLALAGGARAASEEAKDRAARKACLSGNVQKGIDLLSDRFVKTENPIFIYNQGRCFEQNGRCPEAITRFREYLRKAHKASAEDRAEAEKHIADCQALMGQKPEPTPALRPEPAAQRPEPAPVPKAEALPLASTALPSPPQPPPALAVPAPTNPPDPLLASPIPPPNRGRNLRIAGIACGAVGVGAIATAVYFYSRARSYSDKVSNQDVLDPSDESSGKNAETMQWVFYSIGGAAIGTGVLLYALGWPTARPTASIAPLVAPGLAGISARGSF